MFFCNKPRFFALRNIAIYSKCYIWLNSTHLVEFSHIFSPKNTYPQFVRVGAPENCTYTYKVEQLWKYSVQCTKHFHILFALVRCATIKQQSKIEKCHFLAIFGIFGRVLAIREIFSRKYAEKIQLEILHKVGFSIYFQENPQSNSKQNTKKVVTKSPFIWKSID